MQKQFDTDYPLLDIKLIGVNEFRQEHGNQVITNGRDLPWLQDVDSDQNQVSDVWYDLWKIKYRDVTIIDGQNVMVDSYNLTQNDLEDSENYATLKGMLLDAAMVNQTPYQNKANPLDIDNNSSVVALDVLLLVNEINTFGSRSFEPLMGDSLPERFLDPSGDNMINPTDVIQVVNHINEQTSASMGNAEGEAPRSFAHSEIVTSDNFTVNGAVEAADRIARVGTTESRTGTDRIGSFELVVGHVAAGQSVTGQSVIGQSATTIETQRSLSQHVIQRDSDRRDRDAAWVERVEAFFANIGNSSDHQMQLGRESLTQTSRKIVELELADWLEQIGKDLTGKELIDGRSG